MSEMPEEWVRLVANAIADAMIPATNGILVQAEARAALAVIVPMVMERAAGIAESLRRKRSTERGSVRQVAHNGACREIAAAIRKDAREMKE